MVYGQGGDVRAYPLQVLMWHELVNDRFREHPVTVSYCPLCNTAIAYDGRVGDRELHLGTTGRLRYSNMLMYDRQTESWWQQADGKAVVGKLLGQTLRMLPAPSCRGTPSNHAILRDRSYRRTRATVGITAGTPTSVTITSGPSPSFTVVPVPIEPCAR